MNQFCRNFAISFLNAFNRKKQVYFWSLISVASGLVIGVILSFVLDDVEGLVSLSDKNYLSYLKGSAELSEIFYSKFGSVFFASIFCMLLSVVVYTLPLSIGYIGYQSAIMVLSMTSIISKFGFVGVLNAICLILPFNLILILSIAIQISNVYSFCSFNLEQNRSVFYGGYDSFILLRLAMMFAVQLVVCLILSFFVPFWLKSLIIVSF